MIYFLRILNIITSSNNKYIIENNLRCINRLLSILITLQENQVKYIKDFIITNYKHYIQCIDENVKYLYVHLNKIV